MTVLFIIGAIAITVLKIDAKVFDRFAIEFLDTGAEAFAFTFG